MVGGFLSVVVVVVVVARYWQPMFDYILPLDNFILRSVHSC